MSVAALATELGERLPDVRWIITDFHLALARRRVLVQALTVLRAATRRCWCSPARSTGAPRSRRTPPGSTSCRSRRAPTPSSPGSKRIERARPWRRGAGRADSPMSASESTNAPKMRADLVLSAAIAIVCALVLSLIVVLAAGSRLHQQALRPARRRPRHAQRSDRLLASPQPTRTRPSALSARRRPRRSRPLTRSASNEALGHLAACARRQ